MGDKALGFEVYKRRRNLDELRLSVRISTRQTKQQLRCSSYHLLRGIVILQSK